MTVLRVVLGLHALRPPLSGIGRYTWELAHQLLQTPDLALRGFDARGWHSRATILNRLAAPPPCTGRSKSTEHWRHRLASIPWVRKSYHTVLDDIDRWRLRQCDEAIFHACDHHLPPFPGKRVLTVHDLSYLHHPEFHPAHRVQQLQRHLPLALQSADHILTPSAYTAHDVIRQFDVSPERVHVTPLGIGPQFRPRSLSEQQVVLQPLGLSPGGYGLTVGTVEPRKNLLRLLQAYRRLPEQERRHCPPVVAGAHGWCAEREHAALQQAQREGWLHYLQYVPDGHLPALYSGARFVCYPSLFEGFGLPPLEAMACGTPVVMSTASALAEVAGPDSLCAAPEDVPALSACLHQAIEDDIWHARAARSGQGWAATFTWARCAQQTVDVYRACQR